MDKIRLIHPTMEYSKHIMEYRQEFLNAGDSMDGCSMLGSFETAEEWIEQLRLVENKGTCPAGKVEATTSLAIRESDHRIVGMINFRHHIEHPILKEFGGHIGYSVRPSERRKGYAKEMLGLQLKQCKAFGLHKVLITCLDNNIGSEKTIRFHHGVFERLAFDKENNETLKRYWITL